MHGVGYVSDHLCSLFLVHAAAAPALEQHDDIAVEYGDLFHGDRVEAAQLLLPDLEPVVNRHLLHETVDLGLAWRAR